MITAADKLLRPAVEATLAALELTDADAALVKLTRRYAHVIDHAEDSLIALERLGPKLLAALQALGATPAYRARRRTGGGDRAGDNRLAQLRAARR